MSATETHVLAMCHQLVTELRELKAMNRALVEGVRRRNRLLDELISDVHEKNRLLGLVLDSERDQEWWMNGDHPPY